MFYEAPPTYLDICKKMQQIATKYPFLTFEGIGKTVQKREILAFKIGNLESPVLFAGAFHALEWLTCLLLLRFTETLCAHVASGEQIHQVDLPVSLKKHGLIIVPCVNCDGVNLVNTSLDSAGKYAKIISEEDRAKWQANIRGIDLNHNFNAGHDQCRKAEQESGIVRPGPGRYGGRFAHSEPESRAMVRLCKKYNFSKVVAFHSQGEEIYYQYGEHTPRSSMYIAEVMAKLSGYAICEQSGLASHGGFKDWVIDKQQKNGFTLEIGNGKNPLPASDLDAIYEKLEKMLFLLPVL